MKTFAERLKIAIEKLKISQAEAARRCGISQQSINYIISNDLKQSKLAVNIASGLQVNPDWLIYGEGKFQEVKLYEIPVFRTAYEVLKYLHHDLDDNKTNYITIDIYIGDIAFGYLVEANMLAICCNKEYNNQPLEYLCIFGTNVEISKNPVTDLAFGIIEWRTRCVGFEFS
jgi:transcriptional regulator with XRE-family HTH domain